MKSKPHRERGQSDVPGFDFDFDLNRDDMIACNAFDAAIRPDWMLFLLKRNAWHVALLGAAT